MMCSFCGATVRAGAVFCSSCGKKLSNDIKVRSIMYKKMAAIITIAIAGVVLFFSFFLGSNSVKCDSCGEKYSKDSDDYKYIATYGVCSDCYSYVWEDFWL